MVTTKSNNQNDGETGKMPLVSLTLEQKGDDRNKQGPKDGFTFYLLFSIFAAVFGTSYAFGYNAAVINQPYDVMGRFVNESFQLQHDKTLTQSELTTQWSLVISLFLFGGVIGSVWLPEMMSNRYGRTRTLIYIAPLGAMGDMLCFLAPHSGSFLLLYVGRFICGLHSGIVCVILPVLLVELPPVHLRGACGSLGELPLLFGVVTANVVALPFVLGNDNWPILFIIGAGFYGVHVVCLFFAAESPRWLIEKKRHNESLAVLRKLRNSNNDDESDVILAEHEEIKATSAAQAAIQQVSFRDFFQHRQLAWPLVISVNLAIAQQFTGITGIMAYSSEVMIKAGFDEKHAKIANFALSLVSIVGTIICIAIIDRVGRRPLYLLGLLGITMAHVILTISLVTDHFYASIAGFALFRFSISIGPCPITWYMPAEMFSQNARSLALSICLFTNWVCCVLVGILFPQIRDYLNDYTFLPFAVYSLFALVFLFAFLPETRGLPFEQVVAKFEPGKPLFQFGKRTPKEDANVL